MGSQDFVSGSYGHTFFFLDIMGSQDSITGPYGFTSFSWISWAVKDSVTGPYGHIFSFFRYHGHSRLRALVLFMATQSAPFSKIMGRQ
ncbi:hypothetical protein BgiBS90_038361 [Biomphalaria glabrata]|nr:hypothetical protein BgiBS90_038361 [Biomphalaria glabrata]